MFFTGYEYDGDTGLNYAGSRYYEASTGRFISQDPAYLAVGDNARLKQMTKMELERYLADPQLANSYSYAVNNPLKYTDPTGDFIDIALDVGFIGYDLYRMGSAAWNGNWSEVKSESANLGLDIGGAVLPGVTGLGMIRRAGEAAKLADRSGDAAKTINRLSDEALVCRGGACSVDSFIKGNNSPLNQGLLTDVSVQSHPNTSLIDLVKSLKTLSGKPYGSIGYTTVGEIRKIGGDVIQSSTFSNPFHSTLKGITPEDASNIMKVISNPFKK